MKLLVHCSALGARRRLGTPISRLAVRKTPFRRMALLGRVAPQRLRHRQNASAFIKFASDLPRIREKCVLLGRR